MVKYLSAGHEVVLIFLGDMFHVSYTSVFEGIRANNLALRVMSMASKSYFLLGNHEFSYFVDNPFWTLLTSMDSERVVQHHSSRIWQPKGEIHAVDVVDELIDGEVRFLFNHYGCGVHKPVSDGKVTIGLFHQDLYAQEIAEDMRVRKGLDIYEHSPVYFDKSGVLAGYDYAFLGHMHMIYWKGRYICDLTKYETNLYYLSTLGRTNHKEVQDNFLERNIPAVIVDNGKFVRVEDNLFNLMTRSDSVIEEVVKESQDSRQKVKERKLAREHTPVSDDPVKNLRIGLSSSPALLDMFDSILDTGRPKIIGDLKKRVEGLGWKDR